jgi:hypothetical protein
MTKLCVPPPVRRDITPLRPPLAPRQPVARPLPVTDSVALVPVPSVLDIPAHVRARFRSGASIRAIAAGLTKSGIPPPNGAQRWGVSAVRRLLLSTK